MLIDESFVNFYEEVLLLLLLLYISQFCGIESDKLFELLELFYMFLFDDTYWKGY